MNSDVEFTLSCHVHDRSEIVPPWALSLLCLSKRIHSIYLLRLFNDCVAMLIAYLAILLLIMQLPRLSVPLFSLAVSVKMNVLLMAPSVLILLLQACLATIDIFTRVKCMQSSTLPVLVQSVAVGVGLQVMLALPFLLHAPGSYVIQAFDFSRFINYNCATLEYALESSFTSGLSISSSFQRRYLCPSHLRCVFCFYTRCFSSSLLRASGWCTLEESGKQ